MTSFELIKGMLEEDGYWVRSSYKVDLTGSARPIPSMTLCLAAGHIRSEGDRAKIATVFKKRGWRLFDHAWMVDRLEETSRGDYEDNVATAVAKLLLKDSRVASAAEESKEPRASRFSAGQKGSLSDRRQSRGIQRYHWED